MSTTPTPALLKRQAILQINPEFLVDLLREGAQMFYQIVEHGLPLDTQYISCYVDDLHYDMPVLCLLLESPSFDEVDVTGLLPVLNVPEFDALPK